MIIAIPVIEDNGMDSVISPHFGHNPLFAICNTENRHVRIVNIGEHGKGCTPVQGLEKYRPDAVYAIGIGKNAMSLLKERGISIKTGPFKTVREAIMNHGRLRELRESCGH